MCEYIPGSKGLHTLVRGVENNVLGSLDKVEWPPDDFNLLSDYDLYYL